MAVALVGSICLLPCLNPSVEKSLSVMEADEMKGPSPDAIGPMVEKIISTKTPRLHTMMGQVSQKFLIYLKKVIPAKMSEWLLMKYYQIE